MTSNQKMPERKPPAEGTNTRKVLDALPRTQDWATAGELAAQFNAPPLNDTGDLTAYLSNLQDREFVEKRTRTGRLNEYRLTDQAVTILVGDDGAA